MRKKMELTIDDFIKETNSMKQKQIEDYKQLDSKILSLKDPVENHIQNV